MGRRNKRLALAAAVAVAALGSAARADTLFWDSNGGTAPNPAGASGTWDLSSTNWWNGSSNQNYSSGIAPHDAIFGVAGGNVTVSGAVSAQSLTFNSNGYGVLSGTLNLSNAGTINIGSSSDPA